LHAPFETKAIAATLMRKHPFQWKRERTNCFEKEGIVVEIILDEQDPTATLRSNPLDHDIQSPLDIAERE